MKTRYNPAKHHRHSIRLPGYDYSRPGYYFITICVQNRLHLFGNIENGEMVLNDPGTMAAFQWTMLPKRFSNIRLDEYMVMPNHFHAILEIVAMYQIGVSAATVEAPLVGASDINKRVMIDPETGIENNNENPSTRIKQSENTGAIPYQSGQPGNPGQPQGIAPTIAPTGKTLGEMAGAFQSIVTVEYVRGVRMKNWKPFYGKLWQRNYWEHIIRDENELFNIRQYIRNNPRNWDRDRLNGIIENRVLEEVAGYGEESWMI